MTYPCLKERIIREQCVVFRIHAWYALLLRTKQEQEEELILLNREHLNPSLCTDLGLGIYLIFAYIRDFGTRRSHKSL